MSSTSVTEYQLLFLVDFMEKHPELNAKGDRRASETEKLKLWRQLHNELNSCDRGAKKTISQWSRFWSGKKIYVRTKIRKKKLSDRMKDRSYVSSEIEKRIMNIIATETAARESNDEQKQSTSKSLMSPSIEEFPTTESKKWFIKRHSSDTDTSSSSFIEPTFPNTVNELIKGIIHIDSNQSSRKELSSSGEMSSNLSDTETDSVDDLQNLENSGQSVIKNSNEAPANKSLYDYTNQNMDFETPPFVKQEPIQEVLTKSENILFGTGSPNCFDVSVPIPLPKDKLPSFSEIMKNRKSPICFIKSEPLLPSNLQSSRSSTILLQNLLLNTKSPIPFVESAPLLSTTKELFQSIENISRTESTNALIASTVSLPSRDKLSVPDLIPTALSSTKECAKPSTIAYATPALPSYTFSATPSKNKPFAPDLIPATQSSAIECAKPLTVAYAAPALTSLSLGALNIPVSASSLNHQSLSITPVSSTVEPLSHIKYEDPLKLTEKYQSSVIDCDVNAKRIPLQERSINHANLSTIACVTLGSPLATLNTSLPASSLKSQGASVPHASTLKPQSRLRCNDPLKLTDKSQPSGIGCDVDSKRIPLQERSTKCAKLSATASITPALPLSSRAALNTTATTSSLKNQTKTDKSQSSGIGCDVDSKRIPLQERSTKCAKVSATASITPALPLSPHATLNTTASASSLKNRVVPVTHISSTMEPLSHLRCKEPLKSKCKPQSSGICCNVNSKKIPLQALQRNRLKLKKAPTAKKLSRAVTSLSKNNYSALERIAKATEIQAEHTAKQTKLMQKILSILIKK